MDRLRIISASVLVPISILFGYLGGPWYLFYVAVMVFFAATEYVQVLRVGRFRPSMPLVVAGSLVLVVGAYVTSYYEQVPVPSNVGVLPAAWAEWAMVTLTIVFLLAMAWHVFDHERGAPFTASDWAFTVAGVVYLGLLAAHWILVRENFGADGRWWALIVMPAQWIADSGAMYTGRHLGRHKLAPRLSPGKTWQGYAGGVVAGALAGALFGALAHPLAQGLLLVGLLPAGGQPVGVTWLTGLGVGLVCAVVTPLGDLGESIIKRQVNVKDSSNLLPGHGGMLDRIDSQLWAAVIGYYYFLFLVMR